MRSVLFLCIATSLQAQSYPELEKFLNLNESQRVRINQTTNEFQSFVNSRYERLSQIHRDLYEQKIRPQPDATALGLSFYEIASICQESTTRQSDYRRDLRQILTPEQLTQLSVLESNLSLLPATGEALDLQLLNITPQNPPGWRASRDFGALPPPGCPTSFSGVFAFIGGPITDRAVLYPNLIRHLSLTPPQVQQILTANDQFQRDLQEVFEEESRLRQDLDRESAQPNPNPSLLGERALSMEQLCRRSLALETGLEQALPLILNTLQLDRWRELQRALQLLPALAESQNLHLHSRVPENALSNSFTAITPARRIEYTLNSFGGPALPGCQLNSQAPGFFFSRSAPL